MEFAASRPTGELHVILVAPNVSEQMGGEAIKALHVYLELERQSVVVHQVTHERVRHELTQNFPTMHVSYIADTWLERLLYRGRIFEPLLNMIFLRSAGKEAKRLVKASPGAIVHFTSPISPIVPYPYLGEIPVVIGPINGNIHHPPAFRQRESLTSRVRRLLHPSIQHIQRLILPGKRRAVALLVAGGERTYESLILAGCRREQFIDSLDSGVEDRLYVSPRITHSGKNLRFFFLGRLIGYKGVDLIIRSLSRTRNLIELDVIGQGPELEGLKALTASLSLENRVRFVGWIQHSEMEERLRHYRGFVFPSLAEANGIVVQEAMVQGMPVIALNWGGPSQLVTPDTGILIEPLSEEHVISELARTMDLLAEDGDLAETLSVAARRQAVSEGYLWPDVIRRWLGVYKRVLQTGASPVGDRNAERVRNTG